MTWKRLTAYAFGAAILASNQAHASVEVDASLLPPMPVPGTVTLVSIPTLTTPSQTAFSAPFYSVAFQNLPSLHGVVQGALFSQYAIPVAGVTDDAPIFLTGDFGSSLTPDLAQSGRYFSTGINPSSITIGFTGPETSLSLLWGSIDLSNELDLYAGGTLVGSVTGAQVQQLAAGFVSDGFQGFGGTAYVTVTSSDPFETVVAHSGVVSFEFAGVAASTAEFIQVGSGGPPGDIPEPGSLSLLGGLLGAVLIAANYRVSVRRTASRHPE